MPSPPSRLYMSLRRRKCRIPKMKMKMKIVATKCRVVQVDLHGSTTAQIANTESEYGNWCHPMPSRPSRLVWHFVNANTEYRKWKWKLMPPDAESSKSTSMTLFECKYPTLNTKQKFLSPNAGLSKTTSIILWWPKYRINTCRSSSYIHLLSTVPPFPMSTHLVPQTVNSQLLEDVIKPIMNHIVLACQEINVFRIVQKNFPTWRTLHWGDRQVVEGPFKCLFPHLLRESSGP